jgi:hypothetical protein
MEHAEDLRKKKTHYNYTKLHNLKNAFQGEVWKFK